MSADDRRKAILDKLIPLLLERGGDVTTKEIAAAAGIAEGTIFRVFPDKATLLFAAAKEAMNPADGQETFDEAIAGVDDLHERVVIVAGRILDRMRLTMAVMGAVRPYIAPKFHEDLHKEKPALLRPPEFVVKAQQDLHERLTGLFAPYADQLAVPPETAALALRSLTFGSARPELVMHPALTADEIADLVLDGVRTRNEPQKPREK
jgi:AcrR family transcriptional regulator